MKKAAFLFALAAALSFCLLGCGRDASLPDAAEENSHEKGVWLVHVTINPELKLSLNEEEQVVAIEYLNQDAEDICSELELLGQPYETVLHEIVGRAVQQGYVENEGLIHIEIDTTNAELTQQALDQLVRESIDAVEVVAQETGIIIGIDATIGESASNLPAGEDPGQHENKEWPIVEEERDANGNVIKRTITDEEGTVFAYEYTADGHEISCVEHQPDGNVIVHYTRVYHGTDPLTYTETNEAGETYEITCDTDGNPVLKRGNAPGGEYVEEWLWGELVTRRRTTDTDGNVFDAEYSGDVMVKETVTSTDGSVEISNYQDGVIVDKTREITLEDGTYFKTDYRYEDGVLTEEITRSSNGSIDITRYTNGVMVFDSYEYTDGTYEKIYYNENGIMTYREAYVAAWDFYHTTEYTLGSNGLHSYSVYRSSDGYIEEIFYDADGNKESWKIVHEDGSRREGTFDASGNYIDGETGAADVRLP